METLLGMCAQGTIMIVAVLVARVVVRRWVSPLVFPFVWGVAAARLLVPFPAASPFPGHVFMKTAPNTVVDLAGTALVSQTGYTRIGELAAAVQAMGPGSLGTDEHGTPACALLTGWVPTAWLAGTVAVSVAFALLYAYGLMRLSCGTSTQDPRLKRGPVLTARNGDCTYESRQPSAHRSPMAR